MFLFERNRYSVGTYGDLLATWILAGFLLGAVDSKEYCHNADFTAECTEANEVILITSALYGRMAIGPCVKTDFGFVGCFRDVIEHAHERCSGRKSCSIRVPDATLDRTKPCNEDLKSYLEATFVCVKIAVPTESGSCELDTSLTSDSGYISSMGMSNSVKRCGSIDNPWTISAQPGQTVGVSLLDFSPSFNQQSGNASVVSVPPATTPSASCDQVAVIEEKFGSSSTPVKSFLCGNGTQTSSRNYSSSGHVIKISVLFINSEDYNFLIKFTALGCPDSLPTPSNVFMRRQANQMSVRCHSSEITWQLTCVGNRWDGPTANCSSASHKPIRDVLPSLSMGASILIILGVSLAIGLIVLLFGLYYMKRRRGMGLTGHGLHMRDMKPLNSDAGYEAASVYARNTAFEQNARIPASSSGGTTSSGGGGGGKGIACGNADDGNEYEYVWEMPSNPIPKPRRTAAVTGASTIDSGRIHKQSATVAGPVRSRPDVLAKSPDEKSFGHDGRGQCSCLHQQQQVAQTMPNKGSGGGSSRWKDENKSRFSRLEARSKPSTSQQQQNPEKMFVSNTVNILPKRTSTEPRPTTSSGSAEAVRVCRHCGHSVGTNDLPTPTGITGTGPVAPRNAAPGTDTMSRRVINTAAAPGPGSATMSRRFTTDSTANRSAANTPITYPRQQRH